VTTDEEEAPSIPIENEVEVVEIERPLWECPCCLNNHVAALALPCDHLVCGDCFPRLNSCPLCRDSIAGPSSVSVVPLTVRSAKRGQRALEVDLTHNDEDEGAAGAKWCCPQCANLRTKGSSCNECKAARCEDCWKRSQYKCVFCTIGTPSRLPLRS